MRGDYTVLNVSVFYIQAMSPGNLRQVDWISPKDALIYVMYRKHKSIEKDGHRAMVLLTLHSRSGLGRAG